MIQEQLGNILGRQEDPPVTWKQKTKHILVAHWRGVWIVIFPVVMIFLVVPLPGQKHAWCGYTLIVMASYWVSECIPLPIASMLPLLIFPLTGVMDAKATAKCYFNDTVMMFLGSLMLAASVEQSGLHKRLALCAVRCIGYSHSKLLFTMSFVTMFLSMWIDNTAATTMMVPIIFALLHVFEDEGLLTVFDKDKDGDEVASSMTRCYFCSVAYSASIGGVGTLLGSGTNLVFKGLFKVECKDAKDYLSFAYFSAFSVPFMVVMEFCMYLWMIFKYLGFLRPGSKAAHRSYISPAGIEGCKKAVDEKWKALGPLTSWEVVVGILFISTMILFFSRSPVIFLGWGDYLEEYYGTIDHIKDSALCYSCIFLMMILPFKCHIFKHCAAKYKEDIPKRPITSIINWTKMSAKMPYDFIFLLGAGFSLSTAANKENTDLNSRLGSILQKMESLPNAAIIFILIAFTVLLTNFTSNIASVNVLGPMAMTMAKSVKQNPLQYIVAIGYSSSYPFLLPTGTPPNLVVKMATKMKTFDMIVAGSMPTITTILLFYAAVMLWAPVVWPDITDRVPAWCADTGGAPTPTTIPPTTTLAATP